MTKVTQIEDRSATVAWSPIGSHADVVALGAKDSRSSGFDNYGGELELFDLGITSPNGNNKPHVIGSIKTTSRFSSIAWTKNVNIQNYHLGLIAGGMDNGTIEIYNPSSIINANNSNNNSNNNNTTSGIDNKALLSSIESNKNGAISAIQFNPHSTSSSLLATGSSMGELLITSLDDPMRPTVTSPGGGSGSDPNNAGEITSLAWNTEVSHIIASSNGNGMTTIWDLKQNKPWCELRSESSGSAVSCLQWNPSQGMHLMTSSADDRNPVIKLWDLRASMTMPLATTEGVEGGHVKGILDMDWCPFDDTLLVTCGKDDRTLLWDLISFKPICEIPNDANDGLGGTDGSSSGAAHTSSSGLGGIGESSSFGVGLNTSQQKRYDVKWSPIRRGLLSTCSFDRKVQAHSVLGIATKCGRPPKWMKPASGVSTGFGGSITSFNSTNKVISISTYVEKPDLKAAVEEFESATASGNHTAFSAMKQEQATNIGDSYEAQVWGFMQVIFGENARSKLLYFLGFDPEKIHQLACDYVEEKKTAEMDLSKLSIDDQRRPSPMMSKEAENTVNQALLVGNFDAAVECCIRSGNLADALVLASCGGAELWAKTQAHYFASELHKRPFLSVVSAVINNNLGDFVTSSDPTKWHETLAAICSYGTQEEFSPLCELLGDQLEAVNDFANASLCYMCALNLEKASKYWLLRPNSANSNGNEDYMSIHQFVEKVAIFMLASEQTDDIPEEVGDVLFKYAKIMVDQGMFASAAKYCRSNKQECKELRDRLYRSKESQYCIEALGKTPEFPFQFTHVSPAPARPTNRGNTNTPGNVNSAAENKQKSYGQNKKNGYSQGNSPQQPNTQQTNNAYASNNVAHQAHEHNTQLASGWVIYQDPSSGRSYYANTSTGETRWDMPVNHNQNTTVSQTESYSNSTGQQSMAGAQSGQTNQNAPRKLASKYGDGFVSSASHPELAAQYGNVGTSNPYSSSRPGTAVVTKQMEKAPVSGTFNVEKLTEVVLSTEYKSIVDDLLVIVTSLSSSALQGGEKKQLLEVKKGTAIFSKRLGLSDIDPDVAVKVGHIVTAMKHRDFSTANGIHAGLVNSVWKENKDWLKGMKFLIQLSAKRT